MGVGVEEEDTTTQPDLQHHKQKSQTKTQHLHQVEEVEVGELVAEDRGLARAWPLAGANLVDN